MFQQQYGIVNYYEAPLPIGRPDLLGLFVLIFGLKLIFFKQS